MVAQNKMIALWDVDETTMQITKFLILDIDTQNRATDNLPASIGASDDNWLDGNSINTPLGLFAYLSAYYGFGGSKQTIEALKQFKKVDGLDWVDEMLSSFGYEPPERD